LAYQSAIGAQLEVRRMVQRAEERVTTRLVGRSLWTRRDHAARIPGPSQPIKLGRRHMQPPREPPATARGCRPPALTPCLGGAASSLVSCLGPQIVEGWQRGQSISGQGHVAINAQDLRKEPYARRPRDQPTLHGEGSAGRAKPLKSILHMNPDIPIYLATGGEAMFKLTR